MTDTKTFDVEFAAIGRASGKMRNDITVSSVHLPEPLELATDEGGFHGGDGTAPPPLALFAAALTGCLMTQIRAFAKRLKVRLDRLDVHTRLRWQATQTGRDPYVSSPLGFEMDVEIDSPDATDDLLRLIDCAKKGCFIEQSLAIGVRIDHRLKHGGDWHDA